VLYKYFISIIILKIFFKVVIITFMITEHYLLQLQSVLIDRVILIPIFRILLE